MRAVVVGGGPRGPRRGARARRRRRRGDADRGADRRSAALSRRSRSATAIRRPRRTTASTSRSAAAPSTSASSTGSVSRAPSSGAASTLPVIDERGRVAHRRRRAGGPALPAPVARRAARTRARRAAAVGPGPRRARRRDVRGTAPPARLDATRDRPLLGRVRPARRSTCRPTRRARRWASSPCRRRCSAAARRATCSFRRAARRDARRRCRAGARGGRRDGADGRARVAESRSRELDRRGRGRRRGAGRRVARGCSDEPEPALEPSPIVTVHLLFDRPLLRHRRSPRCSDSPAHWVFDRGALTGHPPERGQYLTVVSSGVPDLLEIRGRELVDLIAGRAHRAARPRGAALVARQPRAVRDRRAPARDAQRPGADTERPNVVRAGAWTDTGWPATMEGAVRSGLAAARTLECRCRDGGGMTVVQESDTRSIGRSSAGTRGCSSSSDPDGCWVGELESNATMIGEHLFWLHFLGPPRRGDDRKLANELLARQPRRRHVVELVRGAGRPVDDDRVVRRAEDGRRRRRRPRPATTSPARGGIPKSARLHEVLPRPARPVAVAADGPPCPPELVLAAAVVAVLDLQLRLLGPADRSCRSRSCRRSGRCGRARRRPERDRRPSRARRRRRASVHGAAPPPRDRRRRALGARPPGGRRRLGRDPAAVGLVDPDARRARPRVRGPRRLRRRSRAGAGSSSTTATGCGPEACQSPVWDTALAAARRCVACGVPADHPQLVRAGEWLLARGDDGARATGRCARPTSRPAAGRSSSRTTSTRTSTTPPWSASRSASSAWATSAVAPRPRLDRRHAVVERRLGRVRRRQHGDVALPDPVLRLRRGDRPAERGRHRARGRGARAPDAHDDARSARPRLPPGRAAARRLVVGPLGRQPRLRDRRRAAGARGLRDSAATIPAMRRAVAWLDSVQAANGGFGEDIRSYHEPAWRGRGVPTASQTAWALLAYVAAGEAQGERPRDERRTTSARHSSTTETGTRSTSPARGSRTDFMIRYHLYRLHFPLMALGRLRERLNG